MAALIIFLFVIGISVVMVRVGAIALTLTGLSRDVAFFQAQSAFSGVGFTTDESEAIVSHPARRRIVRMLMLLGTANMGTAIATMVITFTGRGGFFGSSSKLILVFTGLVVLYLLSISDFVARMMNKLILRALAKWTTLHVQDYERVLQVSEGYAISQLMYPDKPDAVPKTLTDLGLAQSGVLVLSVRRKDDSRVGSPNGATELQPGDELTCYGMEEALQATIERFREQAEEESPETEAAAKESTSPAEQPAGE